MLGLPLSETHFFAVLKVEKTKCVVTVLVIGREYHSIWIYDVRLGKLKSQGYRQYTHTHTYFRRTITIGRCNQSPKSPQR